MSQRRKGPRDQQSKDGRRRSGRTKKRKRGRNRNHNPAIETHPDWGAECEICGAVPVVPATGMCGPCTFGEAETAGGNW